MSATPKLGITFLSAGQAQKEFAVNEGFQLLDLAAFPVVEQVGVNDPPASPVLGDCYIVGASPTGAWVGHALSVAGYTSGGWRYLVPHTGMTVYVKATDQSACFRSGAWEIGIIRGSSLFIGGTQVVGTQVAAVASPSGGTVIDTQARGAIDQILVAMREHGLIAT